MNESVTPRRCLAAMFELEDQHGRRRLLIAWIRDDGNGEFLLPAHPDRTLRDVSAGDVVIFNRQESLRVRRLKPYRTTECKDDQDYQEIGSIQEWEDGE